MKLVARVLILLLLATGASAADAPTSLTKEITVTKVISGEELQLSDGRTAKLEGIKSPADEKLSAEAKKTLETLAKDKAVTLENASTDRYGRVVAEIFVGSGKDKAWLQGEMLKSGSAFIFPPTGNEQGLSDMYKFEEAARSGKRGIWADKFYTDMDGNIGAIPYGRFAFVRGKVVKAERVKNKFYLNFGDDWRTDFTITIAARDLHLFKKAGIDPADYAGKTVRVRGWVKRDFGPMIIITSPAQLEVLK